MLPPSTDAIVDISSASVAKAMPDMQVSEFCWAACFEDKPECPANFVCSPFVYVSYPLQSCVMHNLPNLRKSQLTSFSRSLKIKE
jgi:hypothetical protein